MMPARALAGQIDVTLAYGPNGVVAGPVSSFNEGDRGDTPLAGSAPPGGTVTGQYAFVVPKGESRVTVTVTPFGSEDAGVWVGSVT